MIFWCTCFSSKKHNYKTLVTIWFKFYRQAVFIKHWKTGLIINKLITKWPGWCHEGLSGACNSLLLDQLGAYLLLFHFEKIHQLVHLSFCTLCANKNVSFWNHVWWPASFPEASTEPAIQLNPASSFPLILFIVCETFLTNFQIQPSI